MKFFIYFTLKCVFLYWKYYKWHIVLHILVQHSLIMYLSSVKTWNVQLNKIKIAKWEDGFILLKGLTIKLVRLFLRCCKAISLRCSGNHRLWLSGMCYLLSDVVSKEVAFILKCLRVVKKCQNSLSGRDVYGQSLTKSILIEKMSSQQGGVERT
jgi:hypothetical protein